MAKKGGVKVVTDKYVQVLDAIKTLKKSDVLVGVPVGGQARDEGVTNAQIGYTHEYGSPIKNIPARAHLIPGVKSVQDKTARQMKLSAKAAFNGDNAGVNRHLNLAGTIAVSGVVKFITQSDFAPLSIHTISARERRTGREDKNPKPLIDTGQYRASHTYIVRKK